MYISCSHKCEHIDPICIYVNIYAYMYMLNRSVQVVKLINDHSVFIIFTYIINS